MKETEETSGSNALYMDPPGAMRMLAWPCPQGEGHTAWVQQSHIKEKIMRTIAGIRKDKRQDTGIMFLSPEPLLQLRRSLQLPPNTPDPSLGLQIAAVAMNVCGRVSLYGARCKEEQRSFLQQLSAKLAFCRRLCQCHS